MGYNYDDVYHQKMMHWQKQKGHYEPVYIHFHHDPKEQKRQMEAAAQPLPAQLLRSVLSPMSGLLGGLQNLKVSGHQYVKDATKTFISPPMSPILAPSMSAQSPSPPQSPTAEKDFRGLTPLSPPESSKNSLHDELIAQRAETPPALRRKQMEVDPDFYGFQFTMPDFIASKPVLSNLFATLATFAGPPVFIYTFFISGSLIFALSLALPICIIGAFRTSIDFPRFNYGGHDLDGRMD
ncbi:hypothetical protein KEM54_004366 [Ascosphaera aggregata]|nr:hypothetical protein KEM54_004366 [Ascosphaera aggregata]